MLTMWLLLAASIKLYLKDGGHQLVREYEVQQDRIRYYSLERSDWEEIPLDLIDLGRTRKEQGTREEERKAQVSAADAEDKAERAQRREIARVPQEPGVYWIRGEDDLPPLKQAECKVVNNKRRSILKAMSPIPIVAGKSTLEIDGDSSAFAVTGARPEFYMRLSAEERFGMVRLAPGKNARIVEKWSIIPVTKEIIQEQDVVEIFRHQVGEALYKIWPQKPVSPGQYAIVQYTEGKGNTQAWDFRVTAAESK